ncbi:MAG: hypothetical protein KJ638_01045, partial [Chloroflexi bacterium]|nr:hypothetical protein [Chloroflexota bacterium]
RLDRRISESASQRGGESVRPSRFSETWKVWGELASQRSSVVGQRSSVVRQWSAITLPEDARDPEEDEGRSTECPGGNRFP